MATYSPEFAQRGKERITVRQLLARRAGLCLIDTPLTPGLLADPDAVAGSAPARQKPLGSRNSGGSNITPSSSASTRTKSSGAPETSRIAPIALRVYFHDEWRDRSASSFISGSQQASPDEARRLYDLRPFGAFQLVLRLPAMPLRYALGLLYPRSITARTMLDLSKVGWAADLESTRNAGT